MARTPSLAKLSIQELQREIRIRQRRRPALERRRARVAAKLVAIDAEIAALGGMVSSGRRGGRGQNQEGLTAYLRRALDGKTMGVSEVADAVKRMGYVTNSPNFRTIVNAALMRKGKGFKRVGRGQYTAA